MSLLSRSAGLVSAFSRALGPLNGLNRALALLVWGGLAAGSGILLLCWAGVLEPHGLHLYWHIQGLLDQGLDRSRADPLSWITGASLLCIGAAALFILELLGARGENVLLLSSSASGVTTLDISAIRELVRRLGVDTEGVEAVPAARVRRRGKTLVIRGMALLNPYVKAIDVAPRLQQHIQEGVERATGFPVQVRLSTRFQDVQARRRVR